MIFFNAMHGLSKSFWLWPKIDELAHVSTRTPMNIYYHQLDELIVVTAWNSYCIE